MWTLHSLSDIHLPTNPALPARFPALQVLSWVHLSASITQPLPVSVIQPHVLSSVQTLVLRGNLPSFLRHYQSELPQAHHSNLGVTMAQSACSRADLGGGKP